MSKNIDITKPVQTRSGRKVQGLTFVRVAGNKFPIAGVMDGDNYVKCWTDNGKYYDSPNTDPLDIINVPEKKIVPLTCEDIKPTDLFRRNFQEVGFHTIACLGGSLISLNGIQGTFSFPFMRENFIISRDGGTTWENCEKEIEE